MWIKNSYKFTKKNGFLNVNILEIRSRNLINFISNKDTDDIFIQRICQKVTFMNRFPKVKF